MKLGIACFLACAVQFYVQFCAIGDEPATSEPYPIGVERGGSIGNAKWGHVRVTHQVVQLADGYRYTYSYYSRCPQDVRVYWGNTADEITPAVIEPGLNASHSWFDAKPPVWKLAPITLEVRTGKTWQKVGTWRQRGPVPSK